MKQTKIVRQPVGKMNVGWSGLQLCPCVGQKYHNVQLKYRYFFYKINLPFISTLLEMQVMAEVHKLEESRNKPFLTSVTSS